MTFPAAPVYTQQDWATAFSRRMPVGVYWNKYYTSNTAESLFPLANTYSAQTILATDILQDIFPALTVNLSTEWEETLGLPGSCLTSYANSTQAQQAIVTQLTNSGGCSMTYFEELCANLGYTVQMTVFKPLRVGDPTGSQVLSMNYAFRWEVQILSGTGGGEYLFCELSQRCPARLMLYVIDQSGTVFSTPETAPPPVIATISNGVANIQMLLPYLTTASVQYTGGTYTGTVVFAPGVLSQSVTMSNTVNSVTLSNAIHCTIG